MRVLVVEDEPKIAAALKRGLAQESFAVDVESDGEGAVGAATATAYDVIVLDLMLPGGFDGVEACRRIRAAGVRTPILMLTAKDRVGDRVTGLDAGADDYLPKPFAFEELLARLRALLRRPPDVGENVLSAGDLTLDTATYEVRRAGRPIELSKREYSLLEYLMRHPDQVLSKDQIIEHVWDYDADVLPNTVEVYVRYLRRKIDEPFSGPPLLLTVRGFGYKLVAP